MSRGDNVYASPEGNDSRYITVYGQQFVPGNRSKILLPIVFCRDCGQEYYAVRVVLDQETNQRIFEPRELSDRHRDEQSEAGFLYHNPLKPWPENYEEVLDRLPNEWLEENGGIARLRKTRQKDLPENVFLGANGREADDGISFSYIRAPFRLFMRRRWRDSTIIVLQM